MMTGPQIREARARRGWDSRELAQKAKIRLAALIRAEGSTGVPAISAAEASAIERALEEAGNTLSGEGAVRS